MMLLMGKREILGNEMRYRHCRGKIIMIIKKQLRQLYTKKFENSEETDNFLGTYNLLKSLKRNAIDLSPLHRIGSLTSSQ